MGYSLTALRAYDDGGIKKCANSGWPRAKL
ncbi:hypothetical protein SBA2_30069 [Acidobacteriia bacterium SbA2]|nr:hypothetical protein SBA2_30069 [Acidobacteriia bacterium SbA2]